MGEVSYRPLIEDMVWSYSRIECFDDCPYRWYLKYISGMKESPMFYTSYGSFMHRLLERVFKGEMTKEEAKLKFLLSFKDEVKGIRPAQSTVDKYIRAAASYFDNLKPFPYAPLMIEKTLHFSVADTPFVCVIDYVGEQDGDLAIIDHKSRELKPRSKRKKPTQNDLEIDKMLRQLYLYSEALHQNIGKYPSKLCFNCFRSNVLIEEPFDYDRLLETKKWAAGKIDLIADTDDFYPRLDYFFCYSLCGFKDRCCYWEMR